MRELYPNLGKCELLERNIQDNLVFFTCFIAAIMLLIVINVNSSFAIEFTNYTSTKYQIQFQYPSSWNVTEISDGFNEVTGIEITGIGIRKSPEGGSPFILIMFLGGAEAKAMSIVGIVRTVNILVEQAQTDFFSETRIIEKPTLLSINGKQAATFLFTSKDKFDTEAFTMGHQMWATNLEDHSIFIDFTATTYVFDSPDNIQIRDQFIKSIKFLE